MEYAKWAIPIGLFLSCLVPSVMGDSKPKPGVPTPNTCYSPPPEFQGVKITDTFQDTNGASCAGYGFMPRGSTGPLCFHVVCQDAPCTEWTYRKDVCYDQPANEIKSTSYRGPPENEDGGAYDTDRA